MILGKSIDKAQIKKIPIRVWSLTDEINATLKSLHEENLEKIPDEKYILIKAFYEATPLSELNKRPKLMLVPGGKNNDLNNPLNQTAAPGAIDPFEAAMMAELEAKKVADVATAQPAVVAPIVAPAVAPVETPVATAEVKPAEVATASPEAQAAAPTATVTPEAATIVAAPAEVAPIISAVAPEPAKVVEPVKVATPPKTYTIEDFLNLRKNRVRTYPEEACISNGNCVMYDVQFDQILFFTEKPFKPGQEVIIEFQIHKTFTVTAKIVSIINVGVGSRIISSQPVNYRINAILTHEHLGDRTLLRNFLSKVDPLINTHMG